LSREPSEVASERIFVYGTLRRAVRGAVQSALTHDWTFEGNGRVAGELFDFGPYPGAVPAVGGPSWVRGELYRLPPSSDAFAALDRHEGEDFQRALVEVSLDGGGGERAWIYWYRGAPPGGRVPSGDYVAHLAHGPSGGPSKSGPEGDQQRAGDDAQ
jgi:gamma-glutamylcyclotransferase (GGCT)/AIG2-like uncharacterized protein YtfP